MSENSINDINDADRQIGTKQEFDALQHVISVLQNLSHEARTRIIAATGAFFNIDLSSLSTKSSKRTETKPSDYERPSYFEDKSISNKSYERPSFSEDKPMSPKEFLLHKHPQTDVERVACLAFYLTHFLDTPHFKTLDLSKINTEAAQPKFANAANSANNATKMGYLVQSTKGNRQISAAGEQFVRALPDRDSARQAMATLRPRKTGSKKMGTKKGLLSN